jgi:sugar phosphate isomerase/epimerase
MEIALTTRWNAGRHTSGEAMLEEILNLGFTRVELGYDTRIDLVDGIRRMVAERAVQVDSVHNFCPLPMTAGRGHPEIFTFASRDHRIREKAVEYTTQTIRFAAEIGARVVVTHSGNVEMKNLTRKLLHMAEEGGQFDLRYDRLMLKLQERREKKAGKQFPLLLGCLQQLLPVLEETGVQLAIEVLPTWEAFPTETEFERIFSTLNSPWVRYWHDIGHAQIRENLGLIRMERWLEKLQPHLAGMHLHDVAPPGRDHVMPPDGGIDFPRYARFGRLDILRVIEPTPATPAEEILRCRRILLDAWGPPPGREGGATTTDEETAS